MTGRSFERIANQREAQELIRASGPFRRYTVRLLTIDVGPLHKAPPEGPIYDVHEMMVATRFGSAKAAVLAAEEFYGIPKPDGIAQIVNSPVIFDVQVTELAVLAEGELVPMDDLLDRFEE
jgi:hypothetical protein